MDGDGLNFLHKLRRVPLENNLPINSAVHLRIVHFQSIANILHIAILQQSLIQQLGLVENIKESIRKIFKTVIRVTAGPILILKVHRREHLLLNTYVFVLDRYNT